MPGCSLPLVSLAVSKFLHMNFIGTEPDFVEEWSLLPKLGKWSKMGQKQIFFEFIEKFGH